VFQGLCGALSSLRTGLPQCRPVAVGKLVSMISMKQCNVPLFRDVRDCVMAMLLILERPEYSPLVPGLMEVVPYESGLDCGVDMLKQRGRVVVETMESVIARAEGLDPLTEDPEGRVPDAFFERNEEVFRNCINRDHPSIVEAYAAVESAAARLCAVVKEDFPQDAEVGPARMQASVFWGGCLVVHIRPPISCFHA
jgi:hypothetical protein